MTKIKCNEFIMKLKLPEILMIRNRNTLIHDDVFFLFPGYEKKEEKQIEP